MVADFLAHEGLVTRQRTGLFSGNTRRAHPGAERMAESPRNEMSEVTWRGDARRARCATLHALTDPPGWLLVAMCGVQTSSKFVAGDRILIGHESVGKPPE